MIRLHPRISHAQVGGRVICVHAGAVEGRSCNISLKQGAVQGASQVHLRSINWLVQTTAMRRERRLQPQEVLA